MARGGSISERFRMALSREEGMQNLDQVAEKYGRVDNEPFRFKDHEFQREIMRDVSSRIDVRKCSQVGLTEMMVQKVMAMMAVMASIRIMFSQPTKEMAVKFSKDRIDGLIAQSEYYRGLVSAGSDAAGMKQLGSNYLYIIGTYGANSAISVPAEMIISDETDFSNPTVLGKMNSRLRHAKTVDQYDQRGYRYRFSTPTVDGFGIDLGFHAGDQRYYMCKCKHCNQWVVPDYDRDFFIPGWDRPIKEFSRDHLDDSRLNLQGAFMLCPNPSCHKDLWSSLCDPDRRQWVAKKPSNFNHSYQVYPWDVPKYNTPAAIVSQYEGYPLKADFYNFVIGLPYSDSENTFATDDNHRKLYCTLELWIYGQYVVTSRTVGGMDIGKTCHLTVKVQVGKKWHIIWMEKIVNTAKEPAIPVVLARYDFYRMQRLCIDSGPDITLVNLLTAARLGIMAVVYTSVPGFIPLVAKGDGNTINADRTKTLTLLLNDHNSGTNYYPARDDLRIELYKHFSTTKKVRQPAADGVTIVEKFIKTDKQDHWVHSLNYAGIAAMSLTMLEQGKEIVGVMPGTKTVQVGSKPDASKDKVDKGPALKGMFGMIKPRSRR